MNQDDEWDEPYLEMYDSADDEDENEDEDDYNEQEDNSQVK